MNIERVYEALDIVKRAKNLGAYESNVIEMAAQVIAEEQFGLIKTHRDDTCIKGYFKEGESRPSVQVQYISCDQILKNKTNTQFIVPDDGTERLIIMLIFSKIKEYVVLYNGLTDNIGEKVSSESITLSNAQSEYPINDDLENIENLDQLDSLESLEDFVKDQTQKVVKLRHLKTKSEINELITKADNESNFTGEVIMEHNPHDFHSPEVNNNLVQH